MNILFMGTPEFAVPCLKILTEHHTVCGAVTQPDKPSGRGHNLTPPPVKTYAASQGIPVFQPTTLKNNAFSEELHRLNPELIVVVAYGKLLPKYILDFPKHGCVNVHASLLPKYRGAGPIQRCVIDGESTTGVTTMLMNEGLDTGDMLLSASTPIGETETAGELHDRLALLGAEVLLETVEKLENGTVAPVPQNDALASHAPMISKDDARIDWSKPSDTIVNLVRGMNPWPVAWTTYDERIMKVFRASTIAEANEKCKMKNVKFGEVVRLDKSGIFVISGDGIILVEEIQVDGGKRMLAADYVNGHSLEIGKIMQ